MEHIVQFAVNVDDNNIRKIMEESAAKQIEEEIKNAAHGYMYGSKLNSEPENIKGYFKEEVANYVKEHADTIIEKVVAEVAKNMMKTKKVKDALEEL